MPIQNEHEIKALFEVAKKLEKAAYDAKNNADPKEIQQIQQQLQELQHNIQDARGKAINGEGGAPEPLFEAQLRVEKSQNQLDRSLTNLEIQEDNVQP